MALQSALAERQKLEHQVRCYGDVTSLTKRRQGAIFKELTSELRAGLESGKGEDREGPEKRLAGQALRLHLPAHPWVWFPTQLIPLTLRDSRLVRALSPPLFPPAQNLGEMCPPSRFPAALPPHRYVPGLGVCGSLGVHRKCHCRAQWGPRLHRVMPNWCARHPMCPFVPQLSAANTLAFSILVIWYIGWG